jgi:hypothetical protein
VELFVFVINSPAMNTPGAIRIFKVQQFLLT